jgi:hypothetical protein
MDDFSSRGDDTHGDRKWQTIAKPKKNQNKNWKTGRPEFDLAGWKTLLCTLEEW